MIQGPNLCPSRLLLGYIKVNHFAATQTDSTGERKAVAQDDDIIPASGTEQPQGKKKEKKTHHMLIYSLHLQKEERRTGSISRRPVSSFKIVTQLFLQSLFECVREEYFYSILLFLDFCTINRKAA